MGYDNDSYDDDQKELIYDLRQIYAIKLVGQTLQEIMFARKTNNYSLWFKLLKRDLLTEINQKLDNEEREEIDFLIKEVIATINKNRSAYLNKSSNPDQHQAIEDILIKLEKELRILMEKKKMFGAKEEAEPL